MIGRTQATKPKYGHQANAELAEHDLAVREVGGQHVVERASHLIEADGPRGGGGGHQEYDRELDRDDGEIERLSVPCERLERDI